MCISGHVKRIANFISSSSTQGQPQGVGPTQFSCRGGAPVPARIRPIDKSQDRSRAPSISVATPAVSCQSPVLCG